jgi:hypothetical protein
MAYHRPPGSTRGVILIMRRPFGTPFSALDSGAKYHGSFGSVVHVNPS